MYQVWEGDHYLGVFSAAVVDQMREAGLPIRVLSLSE